MMTLVVIVRILLIGILLVLLDPLFKRKFYLRPLVGEAFVRVGLGGLKIVREREWCWYFSLFHILTRIPDCLSRNNIYRVTLTPRSMTRDLHWVAPQINFFLHINDSDQGLIAVARSFTEDPRPNKYGAYPIRWVTWERIAQEIEPRLNSVIRRVVASVTLEQILTTQEWILRFPQELTEDLVHWGILMNSITCSSISDAPAPTD